MDIVTHRYGRAEEVEIDESDVFEFRPGLPGFERLTRYAVVPEEDSPVEWLQSLEDPGLAFAMIEPFLFYPDFGFELTDGDCEAIGLREPGEAVVRCLLTLNGAVEDITANLLAPIVMNRTTGVARQVVLQGSNLSTRFPLFQTLRLPLSA
jgi:flagellar assembly factor FliW